MKSFKFERLFPLILLVPTVSSLIISSVFAGKKKFKTFSFDTPLLPAIVKVQPNKFHLTFRQYKYMRTPQFKIEGTIPLKAPTIIKEVFKPDPNPEVTEFNIGDMGAIPEANQHLTYDDTRNHPIYAEVPKNIGPPVPLAPQPSVWTPINTQRSIEMGRTPQLNNYPTVHRIRRFAKDFKFPFIPNRFTNFRQNFEIPQNVGNFNNYPFMGHNIQSYNSPPNHPNYYNPNSGHFSVDQNMANNPFINSHQSSHSSHITYNPNYQSSPDMAVSPSSYGPPKYEKVFTPSNHQNNKWIPIDRPSVPSSSVPHNSNTGMYSQNPQNFQNYEKTSEDNHKKLNIGEQYNPSASYVDETMVEKPTYDPDEEEPDEGSVSFSISGPHGGEEVPAGYEAKIKQMHKELAEHPHHIPPGLDLSQVMKYYSHHTFTDALKNNYGYKPAFGPLGLLKSKLKTWKSIL